jgi:hypothetical protein
MACQRNSNRIAALARRVGIPHLAAKSAFYVGLAAGAAGLLALAVPRLYKTVSGKRPGKDAAHDPPQMAGMPEMVAPRRLPALPSRTKVTPHPPLADVLSGKSCVGCSASPASKPGAWYIIGDQAYCQDCAPRAARDADIDLVVAPLEPPPAASPATISRSSSDPIQSRAPSMAANRQPIWLRKAPVEVMTDRGRARIAEGAFFVYRQDGSGTGLAVTPVVVYDEAGSLSPARPHRFCITHLNSGKTLAGPFTTIEEAQGLASILAGIDWRRPAESFSRREVAVTQQVIKDYRTALAEAASGDRALAGGGMRPADVSR